VQGVTTLLSKGLPKPALPPWAAKSVAEYVADNPDAVRQMLDTMGRESIVGALKGVPSRQARRGRRTRHRASTTWPSASSTARKSRCPRRYAGYVQGYVDWLDAWAAEPILTRAGLCVAEVALCRHVRRRSSLPCGRARRTDLASRLEDKSRRLRRSRRSWRPTPTPTSISTRTGQEQEIPAVDGLGVVHITPTGTDLYPVADPSSAWKVFTRIRYVAKQVDAIKAQIARRCPCRRSRDETVSNRGLRRRGGAPRYGQRAVLQHYTRLQRYGDPLREKPPASTHCEVDGCAAPRWARGLCGTHYRRLDDHRAGWRSRADDGSGSRAVLDPEVPAARQEQGPVQPPLPAVRAARLTNGRGSFFGHPERCTVLGCERTYYAKGLCNQHYSWIGSGRDRGALTGFATAEQINARMSMFANRCWTRRSPADQVDHVKPLSAGGSNLAREHAPRMWTLQFSQVGQVAAPRFPSLHTHTARSTRMTVATLPAIVSDDGYSTELVSTPINPTGGRLVAWAEAAHAAGQLGSALAKTSFVPKEFRGKPEERAAAILMGDEIGLSPLQALQGVYVVSGARPVRPNDGRRLSSPPGHEVVTTHKTDKSVTVKGRRRGSDTWIEECWTTERARRAKYTSNAKYETDPAAMLYARAAADVCRQIAPDARAGLAYTVEELEIRRADHGQGHARTGRGSPDDGAPRRGRGRRCPGCRESRRSTSPSTPTPARSPHPPTRTSPSTKRSRSPRPSRRRRRACSARS